MKVVDLHPEELLDKEACGQLTESERERLASHVARCETCRLERQLRADFADEMSDDVELTPEQILAIVEGSAVTKAAPEKAAPEPLPLPVPIARRSRRNLRVYMLVAAALLVGGVAGAGAGVRTWNAITGANLESTAAPEHPREPAPAPQPKPQPQPTITKQVAPAPEPEATSVAVVDAPPPEPVALPVRTSVAVPSVVDGAGALFDAAIEARRSGDYGKAIDLHRTLQARYPKSREARVSHGTIGRLLLDSGDASGALASFDAYKVGAGGRGDLDEVVMVGRATALERLGRTEDARGAWSALLEAFPGTPYAKHARARLEATSAR